VNYEEAVDALLSLAETHVLVTVSRPSSQGPGMVAGFSGVLHRAPEDALPEAPPDTEAAGFFVGETTGEGGGWFVVHDRSLDVDGSRWIVDGQALTITTAGLELGVARTTPPATERKQAF
jgi:hypothetical protein